MKPSEQRPARHEPLSAGYDASAHAGDRAQMERVGGYDASPAAARAGDRAQTERVGSDDAFAPAGDGVHAEHSGCCDPVAPAGDRAQTLALAALRALARGEVLLHPTDTLPGLSFDPRLGHGAQPLARAKGRPEGKPCLGLVPDFAAARRFFAPLPPPWDRALARLWPGPLSVIWTASAEAPAALVHADGTIGLRVPQLPADAQWLVLTMRALGLPLPTTSTNRAGEPPARTWAEALAVDLPGVFAPDWRPHAPGLAAPSTIVRLHADGSHTLVRDGALSAAAVKAVLA